jgi:hypothetical protein
VPAPSFFDTTAIFERSFCSTIITIKHTNKNATIMKLKLLQLLSLLASPAIGTMAAASGAQHRRTQTTTTTTTPLIDGLLTADLTLTDDQTALQVTVTYDGDSWIGFAFSLDKLMANSFAVIGTPADNTVAKYEMKGRITPTLLGADRQTLTDESIEFDGVTTTLKFTKLLSEDGEIAINPTGENIFLYAIGQDGQRDLQFHKIRGDVTVNFATGLTAASDPNEYKNLWIWHGILMALSWVILIPIAILCSVARALLPNMEKGLWFQLHRGLNIMGVLFSMIGFAVAVYIIAKEQGSSAQHFTQKTHHKIGLAVTVLALVNAMVGIFRPAAPHAPLHPVVAGDDDHYDDDTEDKKGPSAPAALPPKTTARKAFEYGHRVLGLSAILLAWFNVGSGAELLHIRYSDDIADYALVAWIVMALIAAVTLALGLLSRMQAGKK